MTSLTQADNDLELGKVGGDAVYVPGVGIVHDSAVHQGGRAGGDDDGHIKFAALGVDGVIPGVAGGYAGKIRINGGALHAKPDHTGELCGRVHALVRIKTCKTDKLVGVLAHKLKNAGVGRTKAIGGFCIASSHNALDHTLLFHVGHDFFNGLWLGAVSVFEEFKHAAKNLVGEHSLNGVRSTGAKSKINDVHVCAFRNKKLCLSAMTP